MLLAIDVGNSQTSLGIYQGEHLLHHWRLQTLRSRTTDEYAAAVEPLLRWHNLLPAKFNQVAIASVVPAAEHALEKFCLTYLQRKPLWVTCDAPLNFRVGVKFPSEVGADRLANAAYAAKYLRLPAVVIDIGTATTFDVISSPATYEGGMILPGVRLWVDSLSQGTAKLSAVDLEFPSQVIGKDTVECIQSGVLYGYCDVLNGLITRLQRELDDPQVVLTGGIAGRFRGRLNQPWEVLPNLTLEGIRILATLSGPARVT